MAKYFNTTSVFLFAVLVGAASFGHVEAKFSTLQGISVSKPESKSGLTPDTLTNGGNYGDFYGYSSSGKKPSVKSMPMAAVQPVVPYSTVQTVPYYSGNSGQSGNQVQKYVPIIYYLEN